MAADSRGSGTPRLLIRSGLPPRWRLRAWAVFVLVAALWASGGHAQTPDPPDADTRRANLAALKQAAFERLQDLHALELRSTYPARSRASVYLGVTSPRLRLQELTVRVDNQPVITHRYSERQARLLNRRANLHRVLRTNVAPGAHTVTVTYRGTLDRPLLGPKAVSETVTRQFEKAAQPAQLILALAPTSFIASLGDERQTWLEYQQARDPRLAMVRYQRATGRKYEALTDLLAMAGPVRDNRVLPLAYDIELAHSYVDFGLREQADAAMRTAFDTGVSLEVLADVWLRIAELDRERGDYGRAFELLEYLRDGLTPDQLVVWQDIISRLYMAEGQFEPAQRILEAANNQMEVLTDANIANNQTPYMRFNYAITLMRDGETDRGRTLLDRLGRITAFGEDQRTLRDKANLLLGYQFLQAEQGATAKHVLQRIRLDGPYSAQALLALGWTELAPHGTRQPRAAVGDEPEPGQYGSRGDQDGRIIKPNAPVRLREDPFSRIQLGPFEFAKMANDERKATARALLAWQRAVEQSPQDPAVQEALVALPYALSKLGRLEKARAQYEKAIATLTRARAELAAVAGERRIDLQAIAEGHLAALPDSPWMLQFLASDRFQEHFENYRHLQRLRADLDRLATHGPQGLSLRLQDIAGDQARVDAQKFRRLQAALADAAQQQGRLAQRLLKKELNRQLDRLDKFLVAARLGVAAFYDEVEPPADDAPTDSQTP